jgi:hypothetical protein
LIQTFFTSLQEERIDRREICSTKQSVDLWHRLLRRIRLRSVAERFS